MSSSGGHFGGGDWGQSDDPWGQGEPTPPRPDQGEQGWVSPTQEWGGGQGDQVSWDTGPPPSSQNWDTGPPPGQWDTAAPGAPPGQWETAVPGGQAPPPGYGPPPGQPQQPWEAGPPGGFGPPPPAPPKSNKGLIIGLSAGGGGLVLVVVLAVVLVSALSGGGSGGGGGGGGTGAERQVAWTVPEPTSEAEAETLSMFVSSDKKTLVRVSGAGVAGINMADGKSKWSISAPGGGEVCSGSREAPDGVVAIVYGSSRTCTTVAAIDVETGKQLWTSNVTVNDEDSPPRYASVYAGQGKIYVSTSERVIGYDAKSPPTNSGDAKPVSAAPKADSYCRVGGAVGSEEGVLTSLRCLDSTSVVMLSPDSLETKWSTKLEGGEDTLNVGIVSANPPAIQVDNATDNGEIRVFDDSGKQAQVVQSQGEGGSLQLTEIGRVHASDLRTDYSVKIVGNVMVALAEEGSSSDAKHSVVGVDLTNGQRSWTKDVPLSENSYSLSWIQTDDPKKAAALDGGSYDTKPQMLSIDAESQGAVTKGDKLDTGEEGSLYAGSGTILTAAGDKLILLKSNPSDGEALITAFGPK